MFKISKFLDSEKENIEIFPTELEINNKKVNTLLIEVNGYINDDEYTFRFILSDINKIFKIKVNEEACLDDDYLLLDETMFTYNGVTDLDTMCDIDVFRIDDNNFEFNIMFQSYYPIIINNNNPIIYEANGADSRFDNDFREAYLKLQSPKCYNLIVLDGRFNDFCNAFELFNKSNTFIISDLDNRDIINQKSYKAHKILVDKGYANVFINNVVKAINTLLR